MSKTMNTHETYVSLETAKLLRQEGFDWGVRSFYQEPLPDSYLEKIFKDSSEDIYRERHDMMRSDTDWNHNHSRTSDRIFYSAPTLAVALRWLREVKHLYVTADLAVKSGLFTAAIGRIDPHPEPDMPIVKWLDAPGDRHEYYEAAIEEGLAFALTRYCKKLTE